MRRALFAALLVLPGLAFGQGVPTTPGGIATLPEAINVAACNGTNPIIKASWRINGTFVPGNTGNVYQVWASNTQWATSGDGANYCRDNDPTNNIYTGLVTTIDAISATESGRELNVQQILTAANLTCQGGGSTVYLCVHWIPKTGAARAGWANAALSIDLQLPGTPTISSIEPGDSRLHVHIARSTSGAETLKYRAVATAVDPSQDPDTHTSGDPSTGSTQTVGGLKNDVAYSVVAYTYSSNDNPSAPSAAVTGTPVPVSDFWEHYGQSDGREQGGCSAGAGGALALLAVLALALLRRRHA